MKLTKRDKVLLYLLLLTIIIFCGITFVINPVFDQADLIQADLGQVSAETTNMQNVVASKDTTQQSIDKYTLDLKQYKDNYLDPMSNNQLDRYVTGLFQSHGLSVTALNFKNAEYASDIITVYDAAVEATGPLSGFVDLAQEISKVKAVRLTGFSVSLFSFEEGSEYLISAGFRLMTCEKTN